MDTRYIDTVEAFRELLEASSAEGTIGVEEGKLVNNTLRRPQFYRSEIKDQLENIDKTYTPHTYRLFEQLYELTGTGTT